MKTLKSLPIALSLILISITAFSQNYQNFQKTEFDDVKHIRDLSRSSFMWELEEDGDSTWNDVWLKSDVLRHEVIKKLDTIITEGYQWWADPNIFKSHFENVIAKNDLVAIERLVEILGEEDFNLLKDDFSKKNWRKSRDVLVFNRWDILFDYLQISCNEYNGAIVEANIAWLRSHTTLQYLSYIYEYQMSLPACSYISKSIKDRNFDLIRKQVAKIEEEEFVHYKSNEAARKPLIEIELSVDNDVFTFGGFNQDRDYTGGGALTLSTNYFALRWANVGWLYFLKNRDINKPHDILMTYQSLSLGMKFFTPYIRYRNNFELADTLFKYDRPFGSYIYLERSKYRLWPKGLIRNKSSLQIGQIGTDAGRNIQALLHRDAVVESQKVYGWHRQIANGGRWMLQLDQAWDVLLFSKTNKYYSVFARHKKNPYTKNFGLNIIGTGEASLGGYLTSFGGGLKLSSSDFTKQSGRNTIKPFRHNIFDLGVYLEAGIRYRYVVHNSLLEGFGYFTTARDDEYDDESVSVYTLNDRFYELENRDPANDSDWYRRTPAEYDQVERHLFLFDFGFKLRLRKMTFFANMTLHKREFKDLDVNFEKYTSLVNEADREFYSGKVIRELEEYRNRDYYGYGTIGFSWLLSD